VFGISPSLHHLASLPVLLELYRLLPPSTYLRLLTRFDLWHLALPLTAPPLSTDQCFYLLDYTFFSLYTPRISLRCAAHYLSDFILYTCISVSPAASAPFVCISTLPFYFTISLPLVLLSVAMLFFTCVQPSIYRSHHTPIAANVGGLNTDSFGFIYYPLVWCLPVL